MTGHLRTGKNAVIIEDHTDTDQAEPSVPRQVVAVPPWRIALTTLLVLAAVAGLALGTLAQVGLGPLAPSAPVSWVFLAVTPAPNEQARQVLAIDVTTGDHQIFTAGVSIRDLALSADRRRLFLASDEGRILVLDSTRGTIQRIIHATSKSAVSYLLVVDDSRLLVVLDEPSGSTLVMLDISSGEVRGTLPLEQRIAGRPVLHDGIFVPVAALQSNGGRGSASNSVLSVADAPLRITSEATVARQVAPDFTIAYIGTPRLPPTLMAFRSGVIDFDATTGLLALLSGREMVVLDIAQHYARSRPDHLYLSDLSADAKIGLDGRIVHVCVGGADGSAPANAARQRFVVPIDTLEPLAVGTDCGVFAVAGDGTVVLATIDRLEVLDEQTGGVKNSFRLESFVVGAASN